MSDARDRRDAADRDGDGNDAGPEAEVPPLGSKRRVNREELRARVRESFITGLAVVVPMLITVLVLTIALRSIYRYLDVFSDYLTQLPIITIIPGALSLSTETLVELFIPVILAGTILGVGLVVNSSRYGERAVDYFDAFIMEIPGVGSVYESFRQMSDVMLDSENQNFRDVKLVEFPHEGAYTLGFVTTETPETLREPAGHDEMLTLFLPLAPNPVMGGHLVHLPAERVMDVDMSVEEGLRAVVTSGVAVADGQSGSEGLDEEDLRELTRVEHAEQQINPQHESPDVRRDSQAQTERTTKYDEQVSPEWANTPDDIVRRERPAEDETTETNSDTTGTPADLERSDGFDPTDMTPAELERSRMTDEGEADSTGGGQPEEDEQSESNEHSEEDEQSTSDDSTAADDR